MIEPGRTGAYLALFSEIGLVLLFTTLAGVGVGYFVDTQLNTRPLLAVIGFLLGAAAGARAIYVLITRFLATFDDDRTRAGTKRDS